MLATVGVRPLSHPHLPSTTAKLKSSHAARATPWWAVAAKVGSFPTGLRPGSSWGGPVTAVDMQAAEANSDCARGVAPSRHWYERASVIVPMYVGVRTPPSESPTATAKTRTTHAARAIHGGMVAAKVGSFPSGPRQAHLQAVLS